ncbi:unnamed protein product [Mucor fragilis]
MGKKKTPVFRNAADKEASSSKDDKINAIRTWDDIEHDSEDDFHDDRGKVLLNQGQASDEDQSDREIYGLDGLDSEDELSDDDIAGKNEEDEEIDDKTWGTSKKAYYDADEGSDIDEMREEEEEALRIQKEQLANMDEADFVDDALAGWGLGNDEDAEADKKLVEDVSKELEDISFDVMKVEKRRKNLPVAEKIKIIQNESPELIDLLDEFKDKVEIVNTLKPLVEKIQSKKKEQDAAAQFLFFKYQTLMNYMTNISFYFALKASEANDIREHPVIQALFKLRQTLEKLDGLEEKLESDIESFVVGLDQEEKPATITKPKQSKKSSKKSKASAVINHESEIESELESDQQGDSEDEQDILNEIQDIEQEFKSLKKLAKKRKRAAVSDDFGELDALDELDMEDKIAKKKSIRDYVAKIDSKQAKNASRYQGDVDLPYRDRVKQERKGVAQPQDTSADLDNADWDEDDTAAADEVRNGKADSDDEYYADIVANKDAIKRAKKENYEAERTPIESRDIEVQDGHKRLASYKMLKNKGLTPHRKKENRNARVKHRNKYAKQMKKLSSTRAVVKTQTAGYGGEMSGVKTNVIKSVKLSQ